MLALILAAAAAAADPAEVELTPAGKAILEQTNAERKKVDAPPVKAEARLTKAAQEFAEFMAREDKFAHDADGRQPWDRATAAGYSWAYCSENIAWRDAPRDADKADLGRAFVQSWMDSPGHKKNLLDPYVTEIGIGAARKGEKVYAVQLFGTPKGKEWEFRVTNGTKEQLKYTLDGKEFTLKPRTTLIHPTVRPVEFAFTPPIEGAEPIRKTVKEATNVTIRQTDEGYSVR
jgi:hypothetical protein